MGNIVLKVGALTKYFGGLGAVRNFDCEIREGQIVGLIGPNGAGKSTFFDLITGFERPTSGTVQFNGETITNAPPYRISKKGIARTFQVVRPLPEMTVLENVMIGALSRAGKIKEAETNALKELEFCGLLAKNNHLAKSLAMADKKLLEIARAMATQPKLLLLDEAMAGLTAKEAETAVELIRRIRERKISIIVVEHVMKVVMSTSDRVIVIHHGEKIAEGPPDEVANDARVIKAYLGEAYVRA